MLRPLALAALLLLWPLGATAQEVVYHFSSGPSAWGQWGTGAGLIGVFTQVESQGVGLEGFLGIGTNRVQGWALWPRVYLEGGDWRPFGELALVQVSETEISVDPGVGLVKTVYTWQFAGVGLGVAYTQRDRTLSASAGWGVNSGQCLTCAMQGYVALHIGFSF